MGILETVRICKTCKIEKHISCFNKYVKGPNGFHIYCKECWNLRQKAWRQSNPERIAELKRRDYEKNQNTYMQQAKIWLKSNPDYVKEYAKMHRENNRAMYTAYRAKRRSSLKKSMPRWTNLQKVRSFYQKANELTKETGIAHHVDHIVPLLSERVCGLHCEHNLQVIPAFLNVSKSNRFWPDMD